MSGCWTSSWRRSNGTSSKRSWRVAALPARQSAPALPCSSRKAGSVPPTASATHNGAVKLRAKAIEVAAELMQAPPTALDIVDGRVVRKDQPAGASMTLGEIAGHLAPTSKTLGEREPGLSVDGWFRVEHQVYPYGIHFAVVRIDRDTGGVHVERYAIAYDIGRAINPALVQGQIVGGFVQGLGGALLEEFTYN